MVILFVVITFFLLCCSYSMLCEEIVLYPPSRALSDPFSILQAGENKIIKFKVTFSASSKPISFDKQRKQYLDYSPTCELSELDNCGQPTNKSCYCEQKIDNENYIVAYNITLNSSDSGAHIKAYFTYLNGSIITSPEVTLPLIEDEGRLFTSEVCTSHKVTIAVGCAFGILLILFIILFVIYFRRTQSLKKRMATVNKLKEEDSDNFLDGNRDGQENATGPDDVFIPIHELKSVQKRI